MKKKQYFPTAIHGYCESWNISDFLIFSRHAHFYKSYFKNKLKNVSRFFHCVLNFVQFWSAKSFDKLFTNNNSPCRSIDSEFQNFLNSFKLNNSLFLFDRAFPVYFENFIISFLNGEKYLPHSIWVQKVIWLTSRIRFLSFFFLI